jgi:hypothetical protein
VIEFAHHHKSCWLSSSIVCISIGLPHLSRFGLHGYKYRVLATRCFAAISSPNNFNNATLLDRPVLRR